MRLLVGLGSTLVLLHILVFSWGDVPAIVPQQTTDVSGSLQTERDILFTTSRAVDWPHYQIWRMNPDGSNPRPVTKGDSVQDNFAVWSPDGRRIAFVSNRDEPDDHLGIYVMNADGSDVRAVGPRSWPLMLFPEWSPDGSELLFSAGSGPEDLDLYVMNADGSDVRQLTSDPGMEECAHWGPGGERIIYTRVKGDTTRLMLLDRDSGETRPVLPDGMEGECAYWAPGGDRIAFTAQPDLDFRPMKSRLKEPSTLEIFVYDLHSDSLTQLTDAGAISNYPRWSPDGRRVVFQSTRASDGEFFAEGERHFEWFDVYTMKPDGTDVRRLTRNQRFDAHPSW